MTNQIHEVMSISLHRIKKPEEPKKRVITKKNRKFRVELKKLLGSHDLCTQILDPGVVKTIETARRLLAKARHEKVGFGEYGAWYITQRLNEKSIGRKIFEVI